MRECKDAYSEASDALMRLFATECDDETIAGALADTMCDATLMFARKQHDYGRGNIAAGGELGVLIRLSDKIQRLLHLCVVRNPNFESMDDSIRDAAVYGIMLAMIRKYGWPGINKKLSLGGYDEG